MGKTFIVAELSANHGHKLETALTSVRAIAEAGVDAVKIQTYTADTLTLDCKKKDFIVDGGTFGTTLRIMISISKPTPHGSGIRLSSTRQRNADLFVSLHHSTIQPLTFLRSVVILL